MEFYEMSGKALRANCSGARFLHSYLTPSKPARKAKFSQLASKTFELRKNTSSETLSNIFYHNNIVTLDAVLLSYRKPKLPNE